MADDKKSSEAIVISDSDDDGPAAGTPVGGGHAAASSSRAAPPRPPMFHDAGSSAQQPPGSSSFGLGGVRANSTGVFQSPKNPRTSSASAPPGAAAVASSAAAAAQQHAAEFASAEAERTKALEDRIEELESQLKAARDSMKLFQPPPEASASGQSEQSLLGSFFGGISGQPQQVSEEEKTNARILELQRAVADRDNKISVGEKTVGWVIFTVVRVRRRR